jgi:hypothetical protein
MISHAAFALIQRPLDVIGVEKSVSLQPFWREGVAREGPQLAFEPFGHGRPEALLRPFDYPLRQPVAHRASKYICR